MPVGVTTTSREVYELHMLILWVCVIIGAGVYGAMIAAIVKFRKSKGAVAAKFTHNGTVEVIWTVIPAVILVAMAVPAAETLIRMEDTRESELTIKVTGYQWRWHYDYIDEGVRLLQHARSREQRRAQARLRDRPRHRRQLPAEGRQRGRRARRHESALARHGAPTCSTRGGCRRSPSRRTPCRASSTRPGSRPTRRAPIAASAPSSAAWITASCRSSCASRAKKTTTRGSTRSERESARWPRNDGLSTARTHANATRKIWHEQHRNRHPTAITASTVARVRRVVLALDHDDESQRDRHALSVSGAC